MVNQIKQALWKQPNRRHNLNSAPQHGVADILSRVHIKPRCAAELDSEAKMQNAWTPRRELIDLLPSLWREISSTVRPFLRVRVAIWFGDIRTCNLALDAVILHREH
jgi:hypothetical protein